MNVPVAVFWGSVLLVLYTYGLFPVLVMVLARVRPRPVRSGPVTPRLSLIIAARNEAATIDAKLANARGLDYPADRLEILVVSDGSTDETAAIARRHATADPRVRLLELPGQGKAPALNAAVAASHGEVLVFSDANSLYRHDALRQLVRPLADPEVGGVAGNQVYASHGGRPDEAARDSEPPRWDGGEGSYWNLDRQLKRWESRVGNAISATGAIYAIRRELFQPVPGGVTDDFVISTRVIAQGRRLVFTPEAVAFEPLAASAGHEFRRKVRVITRGLAAVVLMRELLSPRRHGFYALQLFTHKVLRRLVAFPLLLILLVSPFLWSRGPVYRLANLGQLFFYGCAALALPLAGTPWGRHKVFAWPLYFCLVNCAALIGALNVASGRRIERWEPQH